ncbi:MAG: BamA/TamA family outer membrane protein [Bacteroidota bacterium]
MSKTKKVYILIIVMVFPAASLKAQNVLRVYHMDTAVVLCDSFPVSDSVAAREKLEEIQAADLNDGYFFAGYDSITYGSDMVEAWYRKGVRYEWDTVIIEREGEDANFDVEKEKLTSRRPSPLRIKEWTQQVQKTLFDQGFADATVKVDSIYSTPDLRIKLWVIIQTGGKLYFDGFEYSGYDDFPESLMPALTGMKPGNVYSEKQMKNINPMLAKTGFAELSSDWYLRRKDSTYNVVLPLKKVKSNRFNGMLGIIPGDDVQNFYLTGQLELSLLNAFKRAEHISFYWRAPDKQSQQLNMLLDFPLVYKQFGLNAGFSIEKKDTSFLDIEFTGKINFMSGFSTTGLFYEFEENQNMTDVEDDNVGNISSTLIGLSYNYTKLDYLPNPSRGIFTNMELGAGTRYNKDFDTQGFKSRFILDFQYYYPVFSNWSVGLSHSSGIMLSNPLFHNEIFRMGGPDLFRAYQNYAFWTPWYASLSTDILFYPDKYSSLFLFAEAGVLESKKGLVTGRFCPLSVGGGVNINTNLGVLRISYGIARSIDAILDFRQSQIYIGYKNNF